MQRFSIFEIKKKLSKYKKYVSINIQYKSKICKITTTILIINNNKLSTHSHTHTNIERRKLFILRK